MFPAPAAVVAHQAEMPGEWPDLPVPHMQVGAERVELGFLRGTFGPNRYGPDPMDDVPYLSA
jgi:hypothetical protein